MFSYLAPLFVVFAEPGFPLRDVSSLVAIPSAIEARSCEELAKELQPGRVLVWRHGSTFPSESWTALQRFLQDGGHLLYLGGEPFTLPVTGRAGAREVQPRSLAMPKALLLNQCYRVPVPGAQITLETGLSRSLQEGASCVVLEPRLSDTKDFTNEDGAPGARDALLRPLAKVRLPNADRRFPVATCAYAIDHFRDTWAGSRWTFWLCSEAPTEPELAFLLAEAAKRPLDLRVDPTFGCFHVGERPSALVRWHEPRASTARTVTVALSLLTPTGEELPLPALQLQVGVHGQARIELDPATDKPGMWRIVAKHEHAPPFTTGFWVMDEKLFASGGEIAFDSYTLRKDGKPFPVVGTTVMSPTVHRKFLFEPNAAAWEEMFRELASLEMRLIRTGMWSAFRKIQLDPNAVDEAFLRALEAFYLSARRNDVIVVFSLFAFLPETWGGKNCFLDPRSLEAQRAYVHAVAARMKTAKHFLFDLINEPSFCSEKKLWSCRPNGDEHERRAFLAWLEKRYGKRWEEIARARWRLLPDEGIGLPDEKDFADGALFGTARPYRVVDWVLFAQDAFVAWANQMRAAIREAGNTAAITVGQDEGGLQQRPHPLFWHEAVEFTSMHTWWSNDWLLQDAVLSKAPGKPLLVSETGIMQRELLSGEAIRTQDDFARLLARKIGYAFAGGAFGVVQWCYDVNPFMAIDNEVAIGLRRVDGSYKPEHGVLRAFAAFVATHKAAFESPKEPAVVVVLPTGDLFSARDHATASVRRAIQLYAERLETPVQVVAEHRLARDLPKVAQIHLPACRGIADSAWDTLAAAVRDGAMLTCSGSFESDDAGNAAPRLGVGRRALAQVERCGEQELRYPLAIYESAFAAKTPQSTLPADRVRHWPVPLEWAESPESALRLLARPDQIALPPGLTVRRFEFQTATLLVAINEASEPRKLPGGAEVPPRATLMQIRDTASGRVLGTCDGTGR